MPKTEIKVALSDLEGNALEFDEHGRLLVVRSAPGVRAIPNTATHATVTLSDVSGIIRTSAIEYSKTPTITIPPQSDVPFRIGSRVTFLNRSLAGTHDALGILRGKGVALNMIHPKQHSGSTDVSIPRTSWAEVVYTGDNTWLIWGSSMAPWQPH